MGKSEKKRQRAKLEKNKNKIKKVNILEGCPQGN